MDLGTGSARAFLFDTRGTRLGGVRLPYAWRVLEDGGVETDADALFDRVVAAMDGALAITPAGARVVAVGFSMLWHTLVGVAADGTPGTPVYAWSDTRATEAAGRLRARLDAAAVHRRTGAVLHASYPPARLAWLRAARPALWTAAAYWMSAPEYIWQRLTGDRSVDVSMAAGSGLLDQHTLQWDGELLEAIGLHERALTPLAQRPSLRLSPHAFAHARWPALREAVWRLPVGDGACASIGAGCTGPHRIALSIGTSAAARALVRLTDAGAGLPPPGLFLYRLDGERAVLGGAISNGGLVRAWLRRTLNIAEDDVALDALLAARPPAAHGLTILPFLAGERAPDWPLDATAHIAGLRLATSPLDILQAGMEAVAYRLALVRRTLLDALPGTAETFASGGALRVAPWWAQLLADVTGAPVHVTTEPETSSRGAAMLALIAAGELAGLDDLAPQSAAVVQPDGARHAAHVAALARQIELAARLARS